MIPFSARSVHSNVTDNTVPFNKFGIFKVWDFRFYSNMVPIPFDYKKYKHRQLRQCNRKDIIYTLLEQSKANVPLSYITGGILKL